jgi:SAM-dependent methyltransferase
LIGAGSTLFGRMASLTDPLRARILLGLELHELTVGELCAVFQLPQSTMSRHLKVLTDEGWLVFRAEGTSRRYSMAVHRLPPEVRSLWRLVRDQVVSMPAADQDVERIRSILAARRSKSREFFSSAVGEWDRLRTELVGRRLDLYALLGLLDDRWAVADLGCGTGQVADTLAPFVGGVIAVDDSPAMLEAARERLGPHQNVEVRQGDLENLPIEDSSLDAVVAFLVLQHVGDPGNALREVVRVLKRGGRLLIVDMTVHDREEYRQRMGHVWLGFGRDQLGEWVREAGMERFRYTPLPADAEAKGPALFAATARAPEDEVRVPGALERGTGRRPIGR